MANAAITTSTEAATILRETWDDQFGLDPTEEAIVAKLVAEPHGVTKIGKKLHLRKLKAMTAQSFTASTTYDATAMTFSAQTEVEVQVSPTASYVAIELNPDTINQIIDDGNAIAGWRKQMMASLDEVVDETLLDLAISASLTETGATIDDAIVRAALAKLAKNAKRKFRIGKTPYNIVIHPDKIGAALGIDTLKEYRIRGSAGSAVSGALVSIYGANIEESGLVDLSAGTYYNPLFIQDAWALGWNQKPKMLEVQHDGLLTRFVAYVEFGVAEWFDSSIVSLNTT